MKKTILLLLCAIVWCNTVWSAPNEHGKAAMISPFSIEEINDEADLTIDDDVRAATKWFVNEYGGVYLSLADVMIKGIDLNEYDVIWFHLDRDDNATDLPPLLVDPTFITALKSYAQNGGNLFLSTHAVQLINSIGRAKTVPTTKGASPGSVSGSIYVMNTNAYALHDYYDDANFIYKGMLRVNKNFKTPTPGYRPVIPMTGNGVKQDHNMMWNLGSFTEGEGDNEVTKFENVETARVLATWANSAYADKSAAIVEFLPTKEFQGRCITVGIGSFEWNMKYGNPYHSNIKLLSRNILNYLQGLPTGLPDITTYTVSSNADEGEGSLRQIIDDAVSGATIVIPSGYTIQLKSPIVFSKSLSINGQGATIQAAADKNIFRIGDLFGPTDRDAYSVLFENLKLIGGNISEYPYFDKKDSETNAWLRRGGVMYVENNQNITLKNCTISAATAEFGGAIYYDYRCGLNTNTTVTDCVFKENKATLSGGVMRIYGEAAFKDCVFENNEATKNIGVLQVQNKTSIENCSFINNRAKDSFGALLISGKDGVTISESLFERNGAKDMGVMGIAAGSNTILNCTFKGNEASFYTAVIEVNSETLIDNCRFEDNKTEYNASAIHIKYPTLIKNSYFKDNKSVTTDKAAVGSAILNSTSTATLPPAIIENCTFEGNSASGVPGLCAAFHAGNANAKSILSNCTFYKNTAPHGAIRCARGLTTIVNSTITGNMATEVTNDTVFAGGVNFYLPAPDTRYPSVKLVNNIIAYNYNVTSDSKMDVWSMSEAKLSGSHNIIGTGERISALQNPVLFSYTPESLLFANYSTDKNKIPLAETSFHTVPLVKNSVAVGAGIISFEDVLVPDKDQRGVARETTPCLGSYEYSDAAGLDEKDLQTSFVYPNPVSDYLTIQGDKVIDKIDILHISGKVLSSVMQPSSVIPVYDIPNGSYIICITSGNEVFKGKLIINNK